MLEEKEAARSQFSNSNNNSWLAAFLDLAELKHAPKKAGDCWLGGEELNNRLDRPALSRYG